MTNSLNKVIYKVGDLYENSLHDGDNMEHDVRQFDGENTGDTGEIIKQLTFLNTQEGLQQCMDDEDFYLDIVSTFVEDNVLEDMQTYISPDDPLEDMLRQNTKDALAHLRQMTDADFAALDLTVDFP